MTCFTCKGNIEKATTTYMTEYNGCLSHATNGNSEHLIHSK